MKEFTIKAEPLLRCPFCGGDAVTAEMYNTKLKKLFPIVKCLDCECRTPMTETFEEAITAWNTRKPMERILERLEECKETHDRRLLSKKETASFKIKELQFSGCYQNAIEIVKEEGGFE